MERVGLADNFFDLGGHSLLAMRAVVEIEKRLGLRLGVRRLIFETLAQIAAQPDAAPSAAAASDTTAVPGSGWLGRIVKGLRG